MNIGYNHTIPGVQEPIISLALANTTIACTDATLTINEDVSNIVEAGVIGYKNAITNPDFTTADDVVVFGSYVQGDTVQTSIDLSLLSYESITDTSTKTFYAYGYVKYSDGTYKYSNMVSDVFADNNISDSISLWMDGSDSSALDLTGNGTTINVVGATYNGLSGADGGWFFDGNGDYIVTSQDPTGPFTWNISVTFDDYFRNGNNTNSNMYIFDNHNSGLNRYLCYYNAPNDRLVIYAAGVTIFVVDSFSSKYPSGEKIIISTSLKSGDNSLSINGDLVEENNTNRNHSDQGLDMTFGKKFSNDTGSYEYLYGTLHSIQFRERDISPCEASLLSKKGQGLTYA